MEEILGEVAKYGVASVKRVYGDWTAENSRWVHERFQTSYASWAEGLSDFVSLFSMSTEQHCALAAFLRCAVNFSHNWISS